MNVPFLKSPMIRIKNIDAKNNFEAEGLSIQMSDSPLFLFFSACIFLLRILYNLIFLLAILTYRLLFILFILSRRAYRSFYSYHILLFDLFYFQFLLHQTVGNSFQFPVISVSLLAQPFNGILVTPDIEHLIQPKDGLCVAVAPDG